MHFYLLGYLDNREELSWKPCKNDSSKWKNITSSYNEAKRYFSKGTIVYCGECGNLQIYFCVRVLSTKRKYSLQELNVEF